MEYEQVNELMSKIKGCSFASLDTITPVTLKGGKKNPMQGKVTKHTANNMVMLFTNQNSSGYENMVKRRLENEGKDSASFTLGKLPWGSRIEGTPFIENKGKYYIQAIFNKPGKSEFFLDGQPIQKDEIEGLEDKTNESPNQGLEEDNRVVVRTFALDNIKAIRVLGEEIKEG
jgi:hypothetical protein